MWNDNNSFKQYRRPNREIIEIIEIIVSGRRKISEKDISSEMMGLWDAGLITDKDGKYKNGKSFNADEDDSSGSDELKYRRMLKIMD